MSESALQSAWLKSQKIDLARVGLLATTEVLAFFSSDSKYSQFIDEMKRLSLVFAMNESNAYPTEAAYVIRDLSPKEDLLFNGERIKHNQWIQSNYRIGKDYNGYHAYTYSTSKETKNDIKTILIYGLELLNPFKNTFAERLEFWRSNVKLIAWFDIGLFAKTSPINYQKFMVKPLEDYDENNKEIKLNDEGCMLPVKQPIYQNPTFFFSTPIMYKQNDLMNVRVNFGTDKKKIGGKYYGTDEIKLKGFVVEPIGLTVIG